MMRLVPPVALCLTLAACASPQERCAIDATKDLRTVDSLIAETEGNLARGYAIDREVERRPRLTFCAGNYGYYGSHRSYGVGASFCTTEDIVYRDRPVALDPAAERRKLASLQARKAELEVVTRRALAACQGV